LTKSRAADTCLLARSSRPIRAAVPVALRKRPTQSLVAILPAFATHNICGYSLRLARSPAATLLEFASMPAASLLQKRSGGRLSRAHPTLTHNVAVPRRPHAARHSLRDEPPAQHRPTPFRRVLQAFAHNDHAPCLRESASHHHLIQRILDNPLRVGLLEF